MNSARNESILYVVVWTVIAALPVALELWNLINNSVFKWESVIRWWVGMLPLIFIFLLHNHILIPKFMKKGKTGLYVLSLCLVFFMYGALQEHHAPPKPHFEFKEGLPEKPPVPHLQRHKPPRPFPLPILFKLMLAVMTLGINVVISLIFTYNREEAKRKELENRRLQEELKYLKQQISPHFLMNVLNNIHEMAEEDTKEAQDMILELSCLMRYVLYESENRMTTLSSECSFISSYIALMKRRYVDDIVKVRFEMSESMSEDINVPPLLFISFVENAFKYGVSYNSSTSIDIALHEKDGKIVFSCDNSIPVKKAGMAEGGVGLSNVKRRLDLLYGPDYSLETRKDESRYSVTLIIPSR